jgi:hypothetical protein
LKVAIATLPLLSKISPTTFITSKILFGPAATWVSGGSQLGPHCESGNANPLKFVEKVGVVVNASVASDGTSGSVALLSNAALLRRYAAGWATRNGREYPPTLIVAGGKSSG